MAELERILADLTALTEMVNSGEAGLPAIQRLVELVQRAVESDGASFVEFGPAGGRVIAGSGAASWALGRQVDQADSLVDDDHLERVVEIRAEEIPTPLGKQLAGRGVRRLIAVEVEVAGQAVGLLRAYFSEDSPAGELRRSTLALFGAVAGHLYADNRGLPVYADAPAVATLADAIVVVGPDGAVRSWNPAATVVMGRTAGAALGRPLPVPLPAVGQVVEHRLRDGRWLQILVTALPGGGGRVVTLRDITEAHRREQARELFVAVTSHELRTPVTVIKGYADTLVDHWGELDEAERRDAAERLGQRAGDLARLVERLLSAVGDGSGLAAPMPLPFDLPEAIRTALADLPVETRRQVQVELPDMLPKALGERASLATVFAELITNAIKYSPPGSPVELSSVVDIGTVGFRVADRGIGVRPEHVERVFERFWQAESGSERRYPGVGLGLYLVRRIVERQNGWVSLRPRERGGTVAEVRLPRADLGAGEA
ncbi:MAG: PAS domain-containing sensor histidine kinase [Actinobacteria bacterium 13_2_20CM_2_72_6]|nr:MAG: PAS domain-containing sensor histidine kinase [Actinobacteria bacterium 13_2_20CM_2_72_6]